VAPKVADAIARTASPDDEQDAIAIVEAPDGPRVEARQNRKHGGGGGGGRVHARPHGKPPGGKPAGGKPAGGRPPFKKDKPGGGKPFAGKPKFGGKGKGKPGGPRKG
jgi:ATP-dependent RNA helicase DeaD